MFWVYTIVAALLLIAGFIIMCIYINEDALDIDDGWVFARVVAIFTFGSWVVALLWPVLLVSVVPVLFVYGMVVAVKTLKNKTLDY